MTPDQLHAVYVKASGMDVRYMLHHEYAWGCFMKEGFTADDLKMVCAYLRAQIKDGRRKLTLSSLRFENLIENLPKFADHRAEAKAALRLKPETPRQRALQAIGRAEEGPAQTVRSAAQILAGIKAREEFGALKGRL